MATYIENIRESVEFLDSLAGQVPEVSVKWRDKINTDRLAMTSLTECVLGQLFGSYIKGVNVLTAHDAEKTERLTRSNSLGDYTNVWKRELKVARVAESVQWERRNNGRKIVGVTNVRIDDRSYVAFISENNPALYSFNDFATYYQPVKKVPFVKNDVLEDQHGAYYLFRDASHVVRLTTLTHWTLQGWANEGHKLVKSNMKTGSALWEGLLSQ